MEEPRQLAVPVNGGGEQKKHGDGRTMVCRVFGKNKINRPEILDGIFSKN